MPEPKNPGRTRLGPLKTAWWAFVRRLADIGFLTTEIGESYRVKHLTLFPARTRQRRVEKAIEARNARVMELAREIAELAHENEQLRQDVARALRLAVSLATTPAGGEHQ